MNKPVTVIAPIKLAAGKSEADLLAASAKFQQQFVSQQPGLIRRELVRKCEGEYLDIVQFASQEDAEAIIEKEMQSPECHEFFSVMDMTMDDESGGIDFYPSLETYA